MNDLKATAATLQRPRAARAAEVLIVEHLQTLMDLGEELARGSVPQTGKRLATAEAFMEAHYADPLSVADIAVACGLGIRSLQAAFRAQHGASPRLRLTEIRLDNAYSQLASGRPTSVTEVALGCGFVHLGRFARGYHQRFGEFPSETLRRACRN
ncbi:helix-turn-helix domain-containing protein [Thioclava sp. BHET1]|nr:helix-turn-helix domain-containing protein [Thioclava sp. BHET1]